MKMKTTSVMVLGTQNKPNNLLSKDKCLLNFIPKSCGSFQRNLKLLIATRGANSKPARTINIKLQGDSKMPKQIVDNAKLFIRRLKSKTSERRIRKFFFSEIVQKVIWKNSKIQLSSDDQNL